MSEFRILDDNDEVIEELEGDKMFIQPKNLFLYTRFLPKNSKAAHFSVKIFDPNTNKELSCYRPFKVTKI